MPGEDGNRGAGEAAQLIQQIEERLKERGFKGANVGEAVGALLSDRDAIAEQRDQFKGNNDEARKIIQRQGAELGQLRNGKPPAEGATETEKPKAEATTKTVEQELDEIEASLSDEQWDAAEQFYRSVEDPSEAAQLANDSNLRLEVLRKVTAEVKVVPKSFREARKKGTERKGNATEKERVAKLFETFKQRSGFTPISPSGGMPRGTPPIARGDRKRPVDDRLSVG